MTVATGSMLGPYEVLGFVGAGGMGEVYHARDTRLHRDVAIKILRADRRASEGARQRLLQEARTASALNHPNIATIYDVASVGGNDFIVMEYVTGKTLSALVRAGLTVEQAIRIAIPIADALGRAHQAGIVHRDLKPANVMVTADGTVKILDFGLATLAEEQRNDLETASEDTASEHLAWPGSSGGTPGYMAPEQAAGGTVDARSDIFSFGSLLYEIVTGHRAFKGRSPAETLTKVVCEQPTAPSALVPTVPKELERVILRCLRKEPERRYQHIADVKVELQDIKEERVAAAAGAPLRHRGRQRFGGRRLILAATGGAGVLALAASALLVWRPAGPTSPSFRVAPLTALPGIEASPTFSSDGTQVAYSWDGERRTDGASRNFDLWLKLIGGSEARRLTDDPADDMGPSWSPDGRYIAFHRGRPGRPATIHLVSPLGGVSRKLSDLPAAATETSWFRGAAVSQLAWSPDGRWLAVARARFPTETAPGTGGIHLLPVHGGDPRILTTPPSPRQDRDPAFSPNGGQLAYASCGSGTFAACELRVLDLDADFRARSSARLLASQELTILGIAWTRDGRSLVYGGARINLAHLWRVDADGAGPPERIEAARQGLSPAAARDADRLVFAQSLVDKDIYAFESGRPEVAVASSTLWDYGPSFSPDGRRIAFESGRSGETDEIWIADADGANPQQLTHGPGGWQGSPSWSPDGRRIAFDSRASDGFADVWTIGADGTGLRRLTWGPLDDVLPSWSRDGRWIYYHQERPDGRDIWRVPADGGDAARVTHGGGFRALESFDGKLLLFVRRDDESPLFAQTADGGAARQMVECVLSRSVAVGPDGIYYVGCPPEVPEGTLYRLDVEIGVSTSLGTIRIGGGFVPGMAVSPDGKRVLFSKQVSSGGDLLMIDHFR